MVTPGESAIQSPILRAPGKAVTIQRDLVAGPAEVYR
jgi:hypothetical protein